MPKTLKAKPTRGRKAPARKPAKALASNGALEHLGLKRELTGAAIGRRRLDTRGPELPVRCPIDGHTLATVRCGTAGDVRRVVDASAETFKTWRTLPAPKRGEFVRRVGQKLRERKAD